MLINLVIFTAKTALWKSKKLIRRSLQLKFDECERTNLLFQPKFLSGSKALRINGILDYEWQSMNTLIDYRTKRCHQMSDIIKMPVELLTKIIC